MYTNGTFNSTFLEKVLFSMLTTRLSFREQRVTHILIFITIGLSVLMTPLLSIIPMPVLYGVFLYMGVASLKGLQFFDRILLLFMPKKYQPDYPYLRQVPIGRVHMFTAIQFGCLVVLWVIKDIKQTSIFFPIMVSISLDWVKLFVLTLGGSLMKDHFLKIKQDILH